MADYGGHVRATTIEGRPAVSPTEIRSSHRRPTARDITEHLASIAEQYELGAGWGDMTLRAFCEAVEAKRANRRVVQPVEKPATARLDPDGTATGKTILTAPIVGRTTQHAGPARWSS